MSEPRKPIWTNGMSLRDWLAGMALQGMLAANPTYKSATEPLSAAAELARFAYHTADAMLLEREKLAQREGR